MTETCNLLSESQHHSHTSCQNQTQLLHDHHQLQNVFLFTAAGGDTERQHEEPCCTTQSLLAHCKETAPVLRRWKCIYKHIFEEKPFL